MDPVINNLSVIGVYAAMLVALIAAVGVVTLRSLFHAAIALAIVLVGTAGIFLSLHADFLAMVQILIYVGAVLTLIIFAIMLTSRIGSKEVKATNRQGYFAFFAVIFFLTLLILILGSTPWPTQMASLTPVSVADIGKSLLGEYVFPFEIISVILIAALIGALTIARKDKN